MSIKSICGVIITTDKMNEIVAFYRDVLGLPLSREEHGGLEVHYGVDLGNVHFAIHPLASFGETQPGNATTKIAFEVDSLADQLHKLSDAGLRSEQEPHDEGFGPLASVRDPDGNLIELVELRYEFASPSPAR